VGACDVKIFPGHLCARREDANEQWLPLAASFPSIVRSKSSATINMSAARMFLNGEQTERGWIHLGRQRRVWRGVGECQPTALLFCLMKVEAITHSSVSPHPFRFRGTSTISFLCPQLCDRFLRSF
jgi:hypothetical protein